MDLHWTSLQGTKYIDLHMKSKDFNVKGCEGPSEFAENAPKVDLSVGSKMHGFAKRAQGLHVEDSGVSLQMELE